jgi:hypothetical protein
MPGVKFLRMDDDHAVLEVEAGSRKRRASKVAVTEMEGPEGKFGTTVN